MSEFKGQYDIVVIGAGVLGVTVTFWLSELYDCSIALIEQESEVAAHTSSRNTGVVHRPFYLNPEKKKVFARAAQKSYYLWKALAAKYGLPWRQVGTLEVAVRDSDLPVLEKYREWSQTNGMLSEEIDLLDSKEVERLEPLVSCLGAIHSKTDAVVSFKEFSEFIQSLAVENGAKFLNNTFAIGVKEGNQSVEIKVRKNGAPTTYVDCNLLINTAGGQAVDIAHMMGLAKSYTDLHFRGEYWSVNESFAPKITRNIYSVPKHKDFPFLDPHFIVRHDGRKEIGPNAVLVAGPESYKGIARSAGELVRKVFEKPINPKINLMTNRKFLSLAINEWKSSLSKKAMCGRVQQFIPSLEAKMLAARGVAGIRSSIIDSNGFVPEATQMYSEKSLHILNYNSPGATGAPAFSAYVVSTLQEKGYLDGLSRKKQSTDASFWAFEDACNIE
ncbi:MAG: FAD-dependent oxidoreductase [Thaumarchaeota archaeon]|nr:FAD-dependent oxidoreductase [Nitrososphaerota archaeon]MCL5318577.1 FAD-dependent oxidoreductase [Nitrososphaerota archaeon]